MRQFVFGLLVAGLVWWGYGTWFGSGAEAAPPARTEPRAPAGSPNASLDAMLPPAAVDGHALAAQEPARPAEASSARAEPPPADVGELLVHITAGEPAAVSRGWTLLATGRAAGEAQRLVTALTAAGDSSHGNTGEFEHRLLALGEDNSFLHSAEGRAAADKALAAAMALPDADAIAAGSRLLLLMARGRIEKGDTMARQAVDQAYKQHRIRVDRWLCSPANLAGARSYTVVAGDSLARIAAKFKKQDVDVEAGTIALLNRITNPNALAVGQQVKIPVAKLTAVLEKRSFALMVFVGDQLLRLYWVGHGENDRTPVTEFVVAEKQPRPQWTAPDGNVYPYGHPNNILGEYFIKFRHPQYTGFGAHGTPMPDTICTMSSAGCIRMLAADIEELFQFLPRGARVIVLANESLRG